MISVWRILQLYILQVSMCGWTNIIYVPQFCIQYIHALCSININTDSVLDSVLVFTSYVHNVFVITQMQMNNTLTYSVYCI